MSKHTRLLGVACLYVEDDLRPAEWEMEALRRRAEITAIGMGLVETLEGHRHEHDWLGRAAYELLTTHQRTVVRETLSGVIARVADVLPGRLEQAGTALPETPDWSILGRAVSQEVATVLAELRDSVAQHEERAILHLDMNAVVRRAVEIARPRWEDGSRRRGASVQIEFEPAAEALMAEASVSLVGALVHAIDNAVEALPDGGLVRIRTSQVNGHVVISVGDTGSGVPDDLRDTAFTPLFSTKGAGHAGLGLSILRAVASRHGGSVSLGQTASGGTVVEIRLPAASRPAGVAG